MDARLWRVALRPTANQNFFVGGHLREFLRPTTFPEIPRNPRRIRVSGRGSLSLAETTAFLLSTRRLGLASSWAENPDVRCHLGPHLPLVHRPLFHSVYVLAIADRSVHHAAQSCIRLRRRSNRSLRRYAFSTADPTVCAREISAISLGYLSLIHI